MAVFCRSFVLILLDLIDCWLLKSIRKYSMHTQDEQVLQYIKKHTNTREECDRQGKDFWTLIGKIFEVWQERIEISLLYRLQCAYSFRNLQDIHDIHYGLRSSFPLYNMTAPSAQSERTTHNNDNNLQIKQLICLDIVMDSNNNELIASFSFLFTLPCILCNSAKHQPV